MQQDLHNVCKSLHIEPNTDDDEDGGAENIILAIIKAMFFWFKDHCHTWCLWLCYLMFMICAIFHFKDLRHICSLGFVPRPSPPPAPPAPLSPPPPQPPPRWSWWWRWWWCWPPPIRITAKKQDFKTYLMKMLRILSYFTRLRAPPFSPSTSMSPNHLLGLPGEPHLESPPLMMMTVMMVMVIMMLMLVLTVMVMNHLSCLPGEPHILIVSYSHVYSPLPPLHMLWMLVSTLCR